MQRLSVYHLIATLIHFNSLKMPSGLASKICWSSIVFTIFFHGFFHPGLGCGAISEQLHPPSHRRGGGGGPLWPRCAVARGAGADGRFPRLEHHGKNLGIAKGVLENEENHRKTMGRPWNKLKKVLALSFFNGFWWIFIEVNPPLGFHKVIQRQEASQFGKSETSPGLKQGAHGSLTPAEMRIPWCLWVPGAWNSPGNVQIWCNLLGPTSHFWLA